MKQPPLYDRIIISKEDVTASIDTLAGELIREFKDKQPLFVCLLRGGMPFASRLMFAIAEQDPYFHPELDYMAVSRYGEKQVASSAPKVVMDLSHKTAIVDRPVIVLDDMIDKGGTYAFTKKHLENKGASSVCLAVLVQRELEEPRGFDADFHCFSIGSQEWLTGMGLDDSRLGADANRWAKYIAIAVPSVNP